MGIKKKTNVGDEDHNTINIHTRQIRGLIQKPLVFSASTCVVENSGVMKPTKKIRKIA